MSLARFMILPLLGSLACGAASATVVYDTLGPTNSWKTASWIIGNAGGGSTPSADNYTSADLFVPTGSGYLNTITAPIVLLPFSINSPIEYDIRSDNGGIPGAIIASATVPLSSVASKPALYTATFSGTTFLSGATSYWLTMSATYAGTDAGWQQNNLGLTTVHAFSGAAFLKPGQWQVTANQSSGAARIDVISAVSAVPEVSQAMLLLMGLPLLMVVFRQRSKSDV